MTEIFDVGMFACPLCGVRFKIVLGRGIVESIKRTKVRPFDLCPGCEKMLEDEDKCYIICLETMDTVVICREQFLRMFDIPFPEGRKATCSADVMHMLREIADVVEEIGFVTYPFESRNSEDGERSDFRE